MAALSSLTAFARRAVFDETRDARAVDCGECPPSETPVLMGEVAAVIARTAGLIALRNRVREAARTSGEEREASLRAARVIAKRLGIPQSEIMSESAA